ncbi:MAG: glycosyltransferase [Prevotella sp.]|nr:glycosyltransferase [Candidatus Equicola faecalis]
MTKVLCLIDALRLGGAERQLIGLTSLLKERNFDVTLAMYHTHNFYTDLLKEHGIEPIVISTKDNQLSKLYAIGRFIKNNQFSTVIAYIDGPTKICCLLKMLGYKFNLIVSERNTSQQLTRSTKLKFWLYRFADYIVPNSLSQKLFIDTYFPQYTKKTIAITNFTDTEHFHPIENSTEDAQKQSLILTPARIAKQKNVLNLLYAIRILKDKKAKIHYRWVGDVQSGEEEYKTIVMERVKELDISDYIDFCPATKDVATEYHNCNIVCLPSLFEGYPNAICEAMSSGKVIVCSDVCDNSKIITEGINGFLFNPSSAESIAETIQKALSISIIKRQDIEKTNREKALNDFSKQVFVDKYMKLIK